MRRLVMDHHRPNRPPSRWGGGTLAVVALAAIGLVLLAVGLAHGGDAERPPAQASWVVSPGAPATGSPSSPPHSPTRVAPHTKRVSPQARPVIQKHAVVAMARSVPERIDIPAIDVHSRLLTLGRNQDGTLQVPPYEPTDKPGWYRGSPTPGQVGPSVIVGHVHSARYGPGVFYRLGRLTAGDRVRIGRADGTVVIFRVTRVAAYPKSSFPTRSVYGDIDHPGLRLITCGGRYRPQAGGYQSNTVVYARFIGSVGAG